MNFLYRYYSNLDFILDLIENTRLYFSSPNEFNDPFDCRPKFSLICCRNESVEDWKDFFSILAKEEYHGISDQEASNRVEAAIAKGLHKNKEWLFKSEQFDTQVHDEELEKIRISCFTKTPRNQMMWAHYADKHKGVVLQFRSSSMFDAHTGTYKGFEVDYYSKRISLKSYVAAMKNTLHGDDLAFSRFIYCSKSIEWAQEQEVRFFSNNKYVSFSHEMLTGILLGSQCSPHWESEILRAISSWENKPNIYKEDMKRSTVKIYFYLLN